MNKNITVLVATAGQGVMRSSNNGQSWSRAGIDQGMHSDAIVRCLSTDPDTPQTVLAGTDKGLYQSPDAGRTWQLLDTPLSDYNVWNLTRDPRNPNIIYCGTGTPTPAALFKTTDRGQTWETTPRPGRRDLPQRRRSPLHRPRRRPPRPATASGPASKSTASATAATAATPGATSTAPSPTRTSTASPSSQAPPSPSSSSSTTAPSPPRTTVTPGTAPSPATVFPLNYPRCITVKPGNPNTVFLGLGDFTPGTHRRHPSLPRRR